MEVSQKNVKMIVGASKKLPDIAVIIGVFFKSNQHCLDALRCNTTFSETYTGAESACLAYALFELIREKLMGNPLEISKTRVSSVRCNALNGKTIISWNTQGSFSMLRKTVGVAFACLTPHKLYTRYAENCRFLGCSPDKKVFNKLANEMGAAITKGITVAACGKIKIVAPKLKELLSSVCAKLPKQESVSDTSSPPKHEEYKSLWPVVKVSGIDAILLADYIAAKSGGMAVHVCDDGVTIYNKTWVTKAKSIGKANRINDYSNQKYVKLKDEFALVLAYLAITRNLTDCCTATKIIKSNITPAVATTMLKKCFA
jgi:hypothetical protein